MKDVFWWILKCFGHGIGTILISLKGDYYPFTAWLDFDCTNNVVEYEACVMGLWVAVKRKAQLLKVYGDSALVIDQLRGEWETRDYRMQQYKKLMLELLEEFEKVEFIHLTRDNNQMADALAI